MKRKGILYLVCAMLVMSLASGCEVPGNKAGAEAETLEETAGQMQIETAKENLHESEALAQSGEETGEKAASGQTVETSAKTNTESESLPAKADTKAESLTAEADTKTEKTSAKADTESEPLPAKADTKAGTEKESSFAETATKEGDAEASADGTSPEEALYLPAETLITLTAPAEDYFAILPIREDVLDQIYGKSFPTDGGITTDQLRYLRVLHVDFDGQTRTGELIVNAAAAEDTLAVFEELYENGYQIRSMILVDAFYDAEDPEFSHLERGNQADSVSIKHDNTSAFNYRVASNNFNILSNHAMGRAIDLNPFENPYVYVDGSVDGPSGCLDYVDRSQANAYNHMITADDLAVITFKNHGFSWGGDWEGDKDYQHFDYEW